MSEPVVSLQSVADPVLAPDPRTSRRLFQIGVAVLAALVVWLWHHSSYSDPFLLGGGALVTVLSAWPALRWARNGEAHFPVFEMFMLTGVPFYAVPLLAGHPDALQFSETATWEAAWAVILFQACALAAFYVTRGAGPRSRWATQSLLPERALRYAQAGIWLDTAYLYVNGFTQLVPGELHTISRAVFFGIGTVCLFIEMRRWGASLLASSEKLAIGFNIVVQVVFLFRDLYLIAGISVLLLALIGYVSTSRRLPLVVIALTLPIIAVLHSGKSAMRLRHWEQHAPLPTVQELPAFFEEWFQHGLEPAKTENSMDSATLAGRLFERASLFHMLCLVTERTPELEPYLEGESYSSIPAQIIPSFLWPDKPSSLRSNILLAVHYHLVPGEEPGSVSIAFGMIAEAYANFGLTGSAVLGLLLGFGYKRITLAATGLPQFSALGLLTILLAAWSFQVEQIFATWFVSLLQAAAVVIGGPLLFRVLFRRE